MKAVFAKSLVALAGLLLVVPFVTAALLVGARAVAGAGSTSNRLTFVALALCGALLSGAKGWTRKDAGAREGHELRLASPYLRVRRHAFMNTHGS